MPRKSKISIVDYTTGKSEAALKMNDEIMAKESLRKGWPLDKKISPQEAVACLEVTRSLLDSFMATLTDEERKRFIEAENDELPDADSPDFAAWAAQRNETGRAESHPSKTDTK